MFYSQFILAKKGPLGTIWIAAHLERKLRKNQVADTDIGVSVDSILSPEVPIALRLSSHLLLGVVRIYSRKVNYLFDDCSEALLKVKQAFRSTAVDLPPEESTAPYHSITLPETFELDDFELPDNDIFQGNYVDHHISSREQITLQDTMEGVIYSTSQFGLDERFGDGDTSGLDLDEELLLDKVAASGHAGIILSSDADPQASVQPMTPFKQDENNEEVTSNIEFMQATDNMEVVGKDVDFVEYAQAPSTPGLREEPNVPIVGVPSACDDHLECEYHNSTDFAVKENLGKVSHVSGFHDKNPATTADVPTDDIGCLSIDQDLLRKHYIPGELPITTNNVSDFLSDNPSVGNEAEATSPSLALPDRVNAVSDDLEKQQNFQNGIVSNGVLDGHPVDMSGKKSMETQGVWLDENNLDKPRLSTACQPVSVELLENNQPSHETDACTSTKIVGHLENSYCPNNVVDANVESHGTPDLKNSETHANQDLRVPEVLDSSVHEEVASSDIHVLQRCNVPQKNKDSVNPGDDNCVGVNISSNVGCTPETSGREEACHASGTLTPVLGEGCHATEGSQVLFEGKSIREPLLHGNMPAVSSILDHQFDNIHSRDGQLENVEFPAPEKLLSMEEGLADVSSNLLVESTPDKGVFLDSNGGGAGSKLLSGKKRSFTESTLTVQSLDSVESPGMVHGKRTAESIPDDDDLLSSILVGRRSSVLKVKPSPSLETRSMKRPRSLLRTGSSKRKVLMDDSMVLHGDSIRLQLTSTEDIRRTRKKAPCTGPEISMIQKQLLEEELFSESLLAGVDVQLASLHNLTYDLSKIRVSKNDVNNASSEAAELASKKEDNSSFMETSDSIDLPVGPSASNRTALEYSHTPKERDDVGAQPMESCVLTENHKGEDCPVGCEFIAASVKVNHICDAVEPISSNNEQLEQTTEAELGDGSHSVECAIGPSAVLEFQASYPSKESDHVDDMDKTGEVHVSQQMHVSFVSLDQQLGVSSFEMEASAMEVRSSEGMDDNVVSGEKTIDISVGGNESEARVDFLAEGTEGCASDAFRTDLAEFSGLIKSKNPSTESGRHETSECSTEVATLDDSLVESGRNETELMDRFEVFNEEMECNVKNLASSDICAENLKMDSEAHLEMKSPAINDGENLAQHPPSMMDLEVPDICPASIVVQDDFDYSAVGHDTDFLNIDEDEVEEADDGSMPNAEDTHFIENSGWSSRTRAVAKYLQTLFDKEAENGRKVIPMDNLLVGKTRKEASRMFFEALVLKTKDYIHVEQENPFDNISIKSQAALMKSEF